MNRSKNKSIKLRIMSFMLIMVMTFQIIIIQRIDISAAIVQSNQLYEWVEDFSLDDNADYANEVSDEILLRIKLPRLGTYRLEYYLEDDRKTTIEIYTDGSDMDFRYKVEEYDDNGTYGNLGDDTITNITQSLIDGVPYLEKDFTIGGQNFEAVEDREINDDDNDDVIDVDHLDTLDFSISSSPTIFNSAIGFIMNNKKIIAKWNHATTNQTLDLMIEGYNIGTVLYTEMVATPPDNEGNVDTAVKEILKELSGFEVTPVYLIDVDEASDNVGDSQEVDSASHPDFSNRTLGDRPGLEIQFDHPRKIDLNTWSYYDVNDPTRIENIPDLSNIEYEITLEGRGDTDSLDIKLMLQNSLGNGLMEVESNSPDESSTIEYIYSYPSYKLLVTGPLPQLDENDPIENVKTVLDPLDRDNILAWNGLESSSIYEVRKGFGSTVVAAETQYYEYFPKTESFRGYAYTYLEYRVYWANEEESYLLVNLMIQV